MYLIYILDKIHQLLNESRKSNFYFQQAVTLWAWDNITTLLEAANIWHVGYYDQQLVITAIKYYLPHNFFVLLLRPFTTSGDTCTPIGDLHT